MARIRTIKPEFWRATHDLSEGAALLFVALWNFADDYGVVELDPDMVKANVYPRRDIRGKDIIDRLNELRATDRVLPFRVNGERYGWIANFDAHQAIDRRGKRMFPAPPSKLVERYEERKARVVYDDEVDTGLNADVAGNDSDSTKPRRTLDEASTSTRRTLDEGSSLEQGTGNREQGTGRGRSARARKEVNGAVKKKHGEFVELADQEVVELAKQFGGETLGRYVNRLNAHIGSTGATYQSHYWTLRKWMENDLVKPVEQPGSEAKERGPTSEEVEGYRRSLIEVNPDANQRFRAGVIEPLRDEINDHSWEVFIEPLAVVSEDGDTVTLFDRSGGWVGEHFLAALQEKVAGRTVVLTGEIPREVAV